MSLELIKYAFVAGEVSETFSFRPDLEKYDLALSKAENWFVDYQGGLSTRPGHDFVDFVFDDTQAVKFFDFKFSPDIANNYLIVASDEQLRFVQNGAYVLEAEKTISGITKANPGVVTIASHGWATDDLVKFYDQSGMIELEGRTLQITVLSGNTFSLRDFPSGTALNTTAYTTFVSGKAARVYTVDAPWAAEDLETLRATQIRDTVRFTRWGYPIYDLVRNDHADWDLTLNDRTNDIAGPTGLSTVATNTGKYSVGFVVTAVIDGVEGLPSDYAFEYNTDDPAQTAASVVIKWTPVAGADYYNVYRTRYVFDKDIISKSLEVGFIGRSNGAQFVDDNIVPDFTKTPPTQRDPFANGAIESIEIVAGGSNYDNTSTVTITDPDGTGFEGRLIVDRDATTGLGPVVGVKIINPGSGYTSPTVVDGGPGSGASMTAHVSDLTGNDPAIAAVFQQRQIYAATENDPITIYGSRPKQFNNFTEGDIVLASDPYEFELDSESVAPIRHLVPNRSGLLVATEIGWWALNGEGGVITPTNVQADLQTYSGASQLPPIGVNGDIAYIEGEGGGVRLLTYNENRRVYGSIDLSVLANHMFKSQWSVNRWTYALTPYKQIHAVRSDGTLLVMTVMQEQNIYAWTRYTTRGLYLDSIAIKEGNVSSVYYLIERYLNGRWSKIIERQRQRNFTKVEEAFCVDCGLELGATYPAANISIDVASGTATITADAAVFSSGDTGKIWRGGGGKGTATYVNSTHITVELVDEITKVIPQTDPAIPLDIDEGDWTLDSLVTTISGLWHLVGEEVAVLADGNVRSGLTVNNLGKITLPVAASRVIVGLGYKCIAKNLPLNLPGETVERKYKRIVGAALRVNESRGLEIGAREDETYAMSERTDEAWGEPTRLMSDIQDVMIEPDWNPFGHLYLIQQYPLPATILGYVADVEIGDDPS